eukprot:GHVN01061282.1.p1 GENE.GHVN01061282.1~~GHVN01061282.1.p1  ORF type:complete len:118 (-),score=86.20 GHVN01061282.1:76-429(-)
MRLNSVTSVTEVGDTTSFNLTQRLEASGAHKTKRVKLVDDSSYKQVTASEVSERRLTSRPLYVGKVLSEAGEVSEVSEVSEVGEVSEVRRVSEVNEVGQVSEVSEVNELNEVSEVSE